MIQLDMAVLDWIQAHLRCGLLDTAVPLITSLGDHGIFWVGLTVILLLLPKYRRIGTAVAIALVVESLCCNTLLKPLIARVRPCDVNTAVQLLIHRPGDFSFPSGHTGASFAAVSALFFAESRLWKPLLPLAVLIALSRLYLYVHYPTDILGGVILGIAAGWLGQWAAKEGSL